jgi:predicted Zn-dependent protease
LLAALHEHERAIPLLEQALAARPGLLDAHKALGRALVESGKTEPGLEHLLLVVKESPDDEQIHFLLAQAYRALGKEAEAAQEMRVHQETLRKLAAQ